MQPSCLPVSAALSYAHIQAPSLSPSDSFRHLCSIKWRQTHPQGVGGSATFQNLRPRPTCLDASVLISCVSSWTTETATFDQSFQTTWTNRLRSLNFLNSSRFPQSFAGWCGKPLYQNQQLCHELGATASSGIFCRERSRASCKRAPRPEGSSSPNVTHQPCLHPPDCSSFSHEGLPTKACI